MTTTTAYRLTEQGLVIEGPLSLEEWTNLGHRLMGLHKGLPWMVGDWLAYGERQPWGEMYSQALGETGLEEGTLRNYKYVAQRYPARARVPGLSYSHHAAVAHLPDAQRQSWLVCARENGWSVADLRTRVGGGKVSEPEVPRDVNPRGNAPMSPIGTRNADNEGASSVEHLQQAFLRLSREQRQVFLRWAQAAGQ